MIELKDGRYTNDPRLDRIPQFDERSRKFPIAAVIPDVLRSRSWPCALWLDQGQQGACVSFAWHHEAAASPVPIRALTNDNAFAGYRWMQQNDEWPGEAYSGTSVLAGAKYGHDQGWFDEYRWAFSIDECLRAVSHEGPAVLGIPWRDSMFNTRPDGTLDCSGADDGGHGIMLRGVILPRKGVATVSWPSGRRTRVRTDVPLGRLHNSWNRSWGIDGEALVRADDLEGLLKSDGDCAVPVGRRRP